jgi:tetratricopeptide (TPR) repeat protein
VPGDSVFDGHGRKRGAACGSPSERRAEPDSAGELKPLGRDLPRRCASRSEVPAPWAVTARGELEPLAIEAIASPETVRDHRFMLYQELMGAAQQRGDTAAMNRFGEDWLRELDSTAPQNDDERSALDIARVDAASVLDVPLRVLPALIASEKAMPDNYNASLRAAQMELQAGRYAEAIAACDRGLERSPGPLGQAWLWQVQAQALIKAGRVDEAHHALESALGAARRIGPTRPRENNIRRITKLLSETERAQK